MDKKEALVFASVLLFSISLFVSYVSANQSENSGLIPTVEVFTDKTVYKINETITIYINVTNPSNSPIILQFRSSHQLDYEIRDRRNHLIYRWSYDKFFLMVLTSITIPAGESYVASFTHTPQDWSLEPGTYFIAGVVVGYDVDATMIDVNGEILPEFPVSLGLSLFIILSLITVICSGRRERVPS